MRNGIFRRQQWRFVTCVVFVILATAVLRASAGGASPSLSQYFGQYEIYEIRKLEGGITPDEKINQWKGTKLVLDRRDYSVRKVKIKKPVYKIQRIELPKREGEVVSRELTYFYGVETERKWICRLLVFEGPREKDPIGELEILRDGRLVDIYDGRAFFYRKLDDTMTKATDRC
jgi:hypothetical protein